MKNSIRFISILACLILVRASVLGFSDAMAFIAIQSADAIKEEAKKLVVKIRITSPKEGNTSPHCAHGIIVGVNGDTIYVVTAKHVTRRLDKSSSLEMLFYFDNGVTSGISSRSGLDTCLTSRLDTSIVCDTLDVALMIVLDSKVAKQVRAQTPFERLGHRRSSKMYVIESSYNRSRDMEEAEYRPGPTGQIEFKKNFSIEGYSGGGLFNDSYELIGMIFQEEDYVGKAIPIELVLDQLSKTGYSFALGLGGCEKDAVATDIVYPDAAKSFIKDLNFYDTKWHREKRYTKGRFKNPKDGDPEVIKDKINHLFWQQIGSRSSLSFKEAQRYICRLNRSGFAGIRNWRLPTLREAMSLVTKEPADDYLHIQKPFGRAQKTIWTSSSPGDSKRWIVNFYGGMCDTRIPQSDCSYVRAVAELTN